MPTQDCTLPFDLQGSKGNGAVKICPVGPRVQPGISFGEASLRETKGTVKAPVKAGRE